MADLIDREIPPGEVTRSFGASLVSRIRSAPDNRKKVAIADAVLLEALIDHSEKDQFIRELHRCVAGGIAKGRDIAVAIGVNERSLRRLWRDIVGLEQRKFASLMRFHRALAMIDAGDDLSAVAMDCGYADQPHMAREVKSISGLPASMLRHRLGAETYQALYTNRPSAPWTRDSRDRSV